MRLLPTHDLQWYRLLYHLHVPVSQWAAYAKGFITVAMTRDGYCWHPGEGAMPRIEWDGEVIFSSDPLPDLFVPHEVIAADRGWTRLFLQAQVDGRH